MPPGTIGGEIMKDILKAAIRDQKGNVLILVLVLLVVGGLILAPLLGLMSTGLVAGQVYEKKTAELYAADAGVEDALWRIKHDQIPSNPYGLQVNDKDVWVTIVATGAQQFLVELLDLKGKNWGHSEWMVLGRIQEPGEAVISISWNGSGNEWLTDVGIWLSDTCSYVEGQAIPTDDIRNQYPFYTFQQKSFGGGTAFIWTWDKQNAPSSKDTSAGTLTFEFTPSPPPRSASLLR